MVLAQIQIQIRALMHASLWLRTSLFPHPSSSTSSYRYLIACVDSAWPSSLPSAAHTRVLLLLGGTAQAEGRRLELAGAHRQYYCLKTWETRIHRRKNSHFLPVRVKTILWLQVVLTNPSEVAKVRMQTQRNPHPSTTHQPVSQPKYRGSLHCLKVIIKEEGFGGLYKGCSALLCRDCSASAIYFLSYSVLCDWLTPDGRNKPGRYWKPSGITCKYGLFSPTLRGKPDSRQTSPSTHKTSLRSSWGAALCVLVLAPGLVSAACMPGLHLSPPCP